MSTRIFLFALFAMLFSSMATAQTNYHAFVWTAATGLKDIGTLGGSSSFATAINNDGTVVGYSYLADNVNYHAFIWTPTGGMVDLGTLGGCCSQAGGINSSGHVIGNSYDASGNRVAFFWSSGGGFVNLGTGSKGGLAIGTGINDRDDVTFWDTVNAFVWTASTGVRELHVVADATTTGAFAINNNRRVVGQRSRSNVTTPYMWSGSFGFQPLPFAAGTSIQTALGINDNNEIVGFYIPDGSGASQAFYWSPDQGGVSQTLSGLGGDNSVAQDINISGAVAGYASLPQSATNHAAYWSDHNSAPTDLGTLPGGTISFATSVNDVGQVVGYSSVP